MSVLKVLRQKIAPELNSLFNVPPQEGPAGWDAGWQGREHAFHAFFVARMFGAPADLRSGDFAVISRLMPPLTTLERDAKHAWCTVGGINPIDLSMGFARFGAVPQLRSAVIGDGPNGDWQVRYAVDESILDASVEEGNEILFIERQIHAESAEVLLANPYLFLAPPPGDDRESWAAQHGPEIHAKISLHCFRYAGVGGKSIRTLPTRAAAVAWIAEHYPEPQTEILKLLKA
jgi:hypothetical protein